VWDARIQEPEEDANASPGTEVVVGIHSGPEAASLASLLVIDSGHPDDRSDFSKATTLSIPPRFDSSTERGGIPPRLHA
jgi:hypothetical protein